RREPGPVPREDLRSQGRRRDARESRHRARVRGGVVSDRDLRDRVPDRLPLVGRVARAGARAALPDQRRRAGSGSVAEESRAGAAPTPRIVRAARSVGATDLVRGGIALRSKYGQDLERDYYAERRSGDGRRVAREEERLTNWSGAGVVNAAARCGGVAVDLARP